MLLQTCVPQYTVVHLPLLDQYDQERKLLTRIDRCCYLYIRKKTSLNSFPDLICHESYKNVYVAPDRTKLEREKHKNLVSELKARRTQGESDLVIINGSIIKVKSTDSINTTGTQQRMESSKDTPQRSGDGDKASKNNPFPGYRMYRYKVQIAKQ